VRTVFGGHLVAASALVGMSVLSACSNRYDYAAAPLKARDLAPFSVSLPNWSVMAASDLGSKGRIRLADPGGDERMVEIYWGPGDPLDASTMASMMGKSGLEQLSPLPLHAPLTGTAMRFATKGETKRVMIANLYCKSSDTTVQVWSFLDSGWNDELGMTERILGSVRCNAAYRSAPSLPGFSPRNGYRKAASASGAVLYADARGDMIVLSEGQPPTPILSHREPEVVLFTTVLKQMDLRNVAFDDSLRRMGGKDVLLGGAQEGRDRVGWLLKGPRLAQGGQESIRL